MHPHEQLIHTFYAAFGRRDAAAMVACYHPEIVFFDPAFRQLTGPAAGAMWTMLCARGKDLTIEHSAVTADDVRGAAHWVARYTFTKTGRPVVNRIDAAFEFADGKIIKHTDSFDLWRWTRMALGSTGLLLGWLPPVQSAITKQALGDLKTWMTKHPSASTSAG